MTAAHTSWPPDRARMLAPERSALLVLDMVDKFLVGDQPVEQEGLVDAIAVLLGVARMAGVPTILTRAIVPGGDLVPESVGYQQRLAAIGATPEVRRRRGELGPAGDEFAAALAPTERDIVLEKPRFSAFYSTWLEPLLHNLDTHTLVVTGVASYGAVLATVLDAAWRDLYVLVPAGCVGGADARLHAAALELIGDVCLIDAADIVAKWDQSRTGPVEERM